MPLALEGFRILDLTRNAPGTYCTMLLADLGADVIKIEGPAGANVRGAGSGMSPAPHEPDAARRAAYNPLNRNKRSLALNLKDSAGRELFFKLVDSADALVEGFRPGVMDRLDIGLAALRERNPQLVICSLTGYGQDGPLRDRVGHDLNYVAAGGMLGLFGPPDGPPAFPANYLADYAAGALHAAVGLLAALLARGRHGRGQHVDVAMADGIVTLLASPLANYFASGQVPPRGRDRLTGGAPYYNVYETADGQFVTIGAIEPYFWAELCRALGCEDLIARQDAPEPERSQMRERLRDIFRRQTRAEWEQRLGELDVCFAPVRSLAEVRADPQLTHREMVVDVPGSDGTSVPQAGLPIKLSDTPGTIRHGSPLLGQDTDGVLAELGCSAEQIAAWRAEGVVG